MSVWMYERCMWSLFICLFICLIYLFYLFGARSECHSVVVSVADIGVDVDVGGWWLVAGI